MGEQPSLCPLCGRPLGSRIERHHPLPKSRGGKETIPLHPICHRFIHRTIANKVLERDYACMADLRAHPEIAQFIDWVSAKDPDFSAPTRKRQR